MIEATATISSLINATAEINAAVGAEVDDITYRVYVNSELISTTINPADEDYEINIED